MTDSTNSSGALGAGSDADDARVPDVDLVGPVDAQHERATGLARDLRERDGVRRVRAADDDDGVGALRDVGQRVLPVGGREAEVVAGRGPHLGEAFARPLDHSRPFVLGERRLGEHRDAGGIGDVDRGGVEVVVVLDEPDRPGCDRERADGLVVPGVTDIEDGEALAGPHLGFVMDLGDERADRVDDVAVVGPSRFHDVGGTAVRGQHERRTGGDVVHVVDEDHALFAEAVDDEPVVDDLVVAVHGRLEDPDHPGERLDRHLDAGAEATRLREQDLLHGHGTRVMPVSPYPGLMPAARVDAVAPGSPAARAGVVVGDEVVAVNGEVLRDVIAYQLQVDAAHVELDLRRGGLERSVYVDKAEGAPLGVELTSAVFDRVRTCDNHCPFCFIHQLPKGMRKSLYLKDDDYRLSFLYGNFTTLTRFTEADLERVVTERLGPLYVSIHATDPDVRTRPAAQPPRRDEPPLVGAAARRGDRGARPGGRVPRGQRRCGARRHVARHRRPLLGPVDGRRGAARRERAQP